MRIYVDKYGAVDRRINEQLASGDIVATPEGYVLTPRGRGIVGLFKIVADIFETDPRFLAEPAPAENK